jgi:voltage-gated potassium channel
LRRITTPVVAFAGVVVAGVTGFSLLAGVSVLEATFWMLDLTSIELHFENHAGPERAVKAYAVFVLVGVVLAGLWIGETALSAAFGGQITEELETVRTQRRIDDTNDHVIICGYGIFGRTIAGRLRNRGRDVVAIELSPEEFDRIDRDEIPAINGDARQESVLHEAGIERADAVVAAIDDSNLNIQIAVLASQLEPEAEVIVRIGDETYEPLARRAGADRVVIPEVASGEQVTDSL